MPQPNAAFKYLRADEVAECWAGITDELYRALWNKCVSKQKPLPNLDDSGPYDHVGAESLASHWHRLTPEEQTLLNSLVDRQ